MKRYIILITLFFIQFEAGAQCMVSTLNISTGYNPSTGFAITPGIDGGTPVTDPHWIITEISASVATAIFSTGITEVTIGSHADVITPAGAWAVNPAANPGGWISCINSNTYTTDGTGPSGTVYNMTVGRPFRMCTDDSITLDLYIANDNFMPATDMDGTALLFSQAALGLTSNFTMFTHFRQTIFLTAGVHTFHAVVNNYNDPTVEANPTGVDIYGTFSSASGINSLVYEGDPACGTYVCGLVPNICNTLSLPDTISACHGDSVVMPTLMAGTDSVLSIRWSPITGLSDTTILNPVYHFGLTSGWEYVILKSVNPTNLVVNGAFTYGNSGFNSGYTYVTGASSLFPSGVYTTTTDPHLEHSGAASFADHTTGTGNMMAINGASTPIDVWCQTIDVTPNTTYDFSAWFANWSSDTTDNLPIIQFKINGVLIGSVLSFPHPDGLWTQAKAQWFSGASTVATICINDQQTASFGNDFAIDDISFNPVCVVKDSVYMKSVRPDTAYQVNDTTVCVAGGPITLNAPAGYANYFWNTGSTAPFIISSVSGTDWVYGTTGCNVLIDTFHVVFVPSPAVFIGNDTAFCIGNTLTLKSIQPLTNSYLWSNGSTADSIVASISGTYWLMVATPPGCFTTDSIHVLISPLPIVDLGPDVFECGVNPIPLQSSVSYVSPILLWSDGTSNATDTAFVSGTYWLQVSVAGCMASDTVNITIKFDTLHLYNHDTAICRGASVHAFTGANPALAIQWIPTAGIPISIVPSPTITPDTSAMYYITGIMPGCPNMVDSFYIDVQPDPYLYLGGNRMVCQFDTLHVQAYVSPPWYTHYSYLWSATPAGMLDTSTAAMAVFTAGVTTNLVLTVSTPAGCTTKDSALLVVRPGDFATGDTSILLCPGDSVQLLPAGGVSYYWHPGMYLSDSTSAAPWVRAITNVAYTALAVSQYGCRDTLHININMQPAAVLDLGDSVIIYPGESYQINSKTNCTYFTWFPPDGLSSASVSDPVAAPLLSTKYVVVGATEWGCLAADSINIFVNPEALLAVPNAFTPGGGPNGTLKILKRGLATLNSFRIFDRWGVEVFQTSNIAEGWDGTYKNVPQPLGVYVYQVEATTNEGTAFKKHGNVTLLR